MKKRKAKAVSLGLVSALVIAALVGYATLPRLVIEPTDDGRSWHVIWEGNLAQAAEADPGAGKSGILEIYFVNYTAAQNPASTNTTATIEGWAATVGASPSVGWNNTDDFKQQLKHSTTFYIIVRIRANATHAKRGAAFNEKDVRVRWTSADLSIGADTTMEYVVSQNDSDHDFIWINFYDDNSDAGFSLSKDDEAAITSIKFEAYY